MTVKSPVRAADYSVGEVARIAHVSVRTLHHYHELGLLEPSSRSEAGYRRYSEADLARLQQILFYRELGFGLDEIGTLVNDPAFDRREALKNQRELVKQQITRLRAMLGLIERILSSLEGGFSMSKEEMFEVFGDFDPSEYETEVQERWGDTDAYKVSATRTKRYTKADWARYKAENDAVNAEIVGLMEAGVAATDVRALDAVDKARLLIDRWFYPCSREMHANLGEMYLADGRFTATYDKIRPGMAQYLRDATAANKARG